MCILILFELILNIKIAGSIISFNTPHLSRIYEKLRILNIQIWINENTTLHQRSGNKYQYLCALSL